MSDSLPPASYRSNNDETIVVREAEPDDAANILAHSRKVIVESEFLITQADEFDLTEADEREWIRAHRDEPGQLALVAEISGKLVGLLFFEAGPRQRIAHRGTLHMTVAPEYRGRGVGTALLQTLIDWGESHPVIEKLSLAVLATNRPAIGLYRKLGLVEEGRLVRNVKLSAGNYVDDLLMYRFV